MGLKRTLGFGRDSSGCPFASGFGQVPPYFAGRGAQQLAAVQCLDAMRSSHRFQQCMILWGPRGNGKTAMLVWTARQARARGIQVLKFAASELATREELIDRVAGRPRWGERIGEVSWGGIRWKPRIRAEEALDRILVRRLRKAALALLIDEAHTLGHTVGQLILNAVQKLASEDAPVLLVLAGTPVLTDRLAEMQATFWEWSEVLPFSLLPAQDASDAIRIPFESAGRKISGEALKDVVSASNGYPYFLQIWGRLLWRDVGADASHVTEDDVNSVRSDFDRKRDQLFSFRLRELDRLHICEAAVAVAAAYKGAQELCKSEITSSLESIAGGAGRHLASGSIAAIISQLESVGFIWQPGCATPGCYSRGIPSLMDYVLKAARRDGPSSAN